MSTSGWSACRPSGVYAGGIGEGRRKLRAACRVLEDVKVATRLSRAGRGPAGQAACSELLRGLSGRRRVTAPCALALFLAVTAGVATDLHGQSPLVIAAAAGALLVAATAVGWMVSARPASDAIALTRLAVVGLAGATLWALVPHSPAPAIIAIAMAGLGLRLSGLPSLVAGVTVFAAANVAVLINGQLSLPAVASQDLSPAFAFVIGVFGRSVVISHQRSREAQARAEDLLAQLRLSQHAEAEAAAFSERARLAREVHDILAHSLSGLVLALDTMELLGRQRSADPATMAKMLEQVARARRIAVDGLADTRRAVATLRGDELPGPALLDRLVAETAAATGIQAALTVTGERRSLPPEIGLALYRTAQEALINTAKYAGRDGQADLRLTYGDSNVQLAIEDARSDEAAPPGPAGLTFGGYGLTGMRERAELLGGELAAGPTDTGFRVLLRLPTEPVTDAAALQ
jgi:signal transduction histidine kinase